MNLLKTLAITLTILLSAQSANAIDFATAKSQGLVGEQSDGYIGAVKSGTEVDALVSEINAKRKEAYKMISAENGQPLDVVESLAAKKLYEKLKPSEYYKPEEGNWLQK